jgi:hypothetical protein
MGLCAAGGFSPAASAQPAVPALSGTDAGAVLSAMAGQAAVIFAGHVLAVERHDDAGFVEVTFAIDNAVSGCGAASQYVLHEWSGLWAGHAPRYRVGQQLLMMLHAPNSAGFSSPVDGMDGAIPLAGAGAPALMDENGNVAPDAGAAGPNAGLAANLAANLAAILAADLSWIQARAVRGAQAQPAAAASRRPVALGAPVATGAPIATPGAELSLGGNTVVSLGTLLEGLRGVVSASR